MQLKNKVTISVKDYLSFNRAEQRGIVILLLILSGVILSNIFIPTGITHQPVDFTGFEKEVAIFESEWQKAKETEEKNLFMRTDTSFKKKMRLKTEFIVELNSADTFDLQRLRGIGPSFARRIVNYRQRLGGYIRKEQLLEVFGMDSSRYYALASNIGVSPDSVRRIDLNHITFKELLRHPYFPYEVTKAIMIYRQKNKQFRSLEELKSIEGISDSLFRRVFPYIRVDL